MMSMAGQHIPPNASALSPVPMDINGAPQQLQQQQFSTLDVNHLVRDTPSGQYPFSKGGAGDFSRNTPEAQCFTHEGIQGQRPAGGSALYVGNPDPLKKTSNGSPAQTIERASQSFRTVSNVTPLPDGKSRAVGTGSERGSESPCSTSDECSCDACRNDGDMYDATESNSFTQIKDYRRQNVARSDDLHLTRPSPFAESETSFSVLPLTLTDLQTRRRGQRRRVRQCAFCKIHGFLISVKGHKTFCQFRERCQCTGCQLIRFNQEVSKSQVRLRRQKDIEAEIFLNNSDTEPGRLDAIKRNPMCFKCWVHDSVRVRLKGHRNVCPYIRCACYNCNLNTDRRRITRELRQFMLEPGELNQRPSWVGRAGPVRSIVPYGFANAQPEHQHNVTTALQMYPEVSPLFHGTAQVSSPSDAAPASAFITPVWQSGLTPSPISSSAMQQDRHGITVSATLTTIPYPGGRGVPVRGLANVTEASRPPQLPLPQANKWNLAPPTTTGASSNTTPPPCTNSVDRNNSMPTSNHHNYYSWYYANNDSGYGGINGTETWTFHGSGIKSLSTVKESCGLHSSVNQTTAPAQIRTALQN